MFRRLRDRTVEDKAAEAQRGAIASQDRPDFKFMGDSLELYRSGTTSANGMRIQSDGEDSESESAGSDHQIADDLAEMLSWVQMWQI